MPGIWMSILLMNAFWTDCEYLAFTIDKVFLKAEAMIECTAGRTYK